MYTFLHENLIKIFMSFSSFIFNSEEFLQDLLQGKKNNNNNKNNNKEKPLWTFDFADLGKYLFLLSFKQKVLLDIVFLVRNIFPTFLLVYLSSIGLENSCWEVY